MIKITKNNNRGGGVGFLSLLTLLFIGLKLTNFIDWSWWLVLAPTLFPIALALVLLTLWLVLTLIEKCLR